jgi:hypothetical protein
MPGSDTLAVKSLMRGRDSESRLAAGPFPPSPPPQPGKPSSLWVGFQISVPAWR